MTEPLLREFGHIRKGEQLGPPPGHQPDHLEDLIVACIESLPHATRLYPEIWGWALARRIRAEMSAKEGVE